MSYTRCISVLFWRLTFSSSYHKFFLHYVWIYVCNLLLISPSLLQRDTWTRYWKIFSDLISQGYVWPCSILFFYVGPQCSFDFTTILDGLDYWQNVFNHYKISEDQTESKRSSECIAVQLHVVDIWFLKTSISRITGRMNNKRKVRIMGWFGNWMENRNYLFWKASIWMMKLLLLLTASVV
jgi:hypothetical protein